MKCRFLNVSPSFSRVVKNDREKVLKMRIFESCIGRVERNYARRKAVTVGAISLFQR
jgi:hypothetical protein